MGRGKRLLLFPLPIVPRALYFSLSSALPTIQRGLCGKESLRTSAWEASLDFECETTIYECGSALSSLHFWERKTHKVKL